MKRTAKFFRDLVTDPILFAIVATIVVMLIAGCGETASFSSDGQGNGPSRKGETGTVVVLSQPMNLRYLVNDIVETLIELPAGTSIDLGKDPQVVHPNYRTGDGQIARSVAGFFHPVRVVAVPRESRARYPDEIVNGWNSIAGGLFITTSIGETAIPVDTPEE